MKTYFALFSLGLLLPGCGPSLYPLAILLLFLAAYGFLCGVYDDPDDRGE